LALISKVKVFVVLEVIAYLQSSLFFIHQFIKN